MTYVPSTFFPTEDETTYFSNPGIGWQEENSDRLDTPPESTPYRRAVGEFFWKHLNPADNVYDWTKINAFLSWCAGDKKLGSFRVMSMRGESFGGHQIPPWVLNLDAGAVGGKSSSGKNYRAGIEPNYENVTYQTYWAKFVEALRIKYDGDPRIAYVDISGYGDFGEWTYLRNHHFLNTPSTPGSNIQGHARRFLTELWTGGTRSDHRRNKLNNVGTQTVSYSFPGWKSTQLIMPHGGIRHHTAWVAKNFPDVGHRRDNLGVYVSGPKCWDADSITSLGGEFPAGAMAWDYIGGNIVKRWKTAPVWFEQATNNNSNWNNQNKTLKDSHGSGVHDNWTIARNSTELNKMMLRAGYRLAITKVVSALSASRGDLIPMQIDLVNRGYAPPYPRQGQLFCLAVALRKGSVVRSIKTIYSDTLSWLPNDDVDLSPPVISEEFDIEIPLNLESGTYVMSVGVFDNRLGQMIQLAQTGRDPISGYYDAGNIVIN
jgi:hypothetical protein